MSLTHKNVQDLLQSNRRLTRTEQAALDEHLTICTECRAYAELHQVLLETLPDPSPTLRHSDQEIRQRIGQVATRLERRRWPRNFFKLSLSLAGAGAALAVLLILFLLIPRLMPGQPAFLPGTLVTRASAPGTALKPQANATIPPAAQPTLSPASSRAATSQPTGSKAAQVLPAPSLTGSPAAVAAKGGVGITVEGQTAYTAIGSHLAVVDISHAAAPRLTALSSALPANILKVLSFTNAFGPRIIASAGRYLALFDPSDVQGISLVNQSKLPGPVNTLILDISRGRIYAGGALQSDATKGFITVLDTAPQDHLELIETAQLTAPVQSLALAKNVLYVAVLGETPGVSTISLTGDHFGQPKEAILGISVSSMTATGDMLYLGAHGKIAAFDLARAEKPQLVWQFTQVGNIQVPQTIYGFAVLPNTIFISGLDAAGKIVHVGLKPPAALKTGSVVDSAACLVVSAGQMIVSGEQLEIYDSRDPQQLNLLGSLKLVLP
jgi:hypothetical protein